MGASTGYIALTAVVQVGRCDGQVFLADQNTCTAIEKAGAEMGIKVAVKAGQFAAVAIVERCTGGIQTLPAGDQPALIEQVVTIDDQQVVADQLAARIIKVADTQAKGLRSGNLAATVVQVTQVLEGQRACCGDQAAHIVEIACGSTQVERDGLALQRTLFVVQPTTADSKLASAGNAALVVGQLSRREA